MGCELIVENGVDSSGCADVPDSIQVKFNSGMVYEMLRVARQKVNNIKLASVSSEEELLIPCKDILIWAVEQAVTLQWTISK